MFKWLFGEHDEYAEFYTEDGSLRKDKVQQFKDKVRSDDNARRADKDFVASMDARQERIRATSIRDVLDELDLGEEINLVIHDWGSAMGFQYARENANKIKSITFMEAIVMPLTWDQWPENARKYQNMTRLSPVKNNVSHRRQSGQKCKKILEHDQILL